MAHQHRRTISTPLVTPFQDFSLRTRSLYNSDLAVNLRSSTSDHEIGRALDRLYDIVKRTEEANGLSGPLKQWNMPSSTSGLHFNRHSRPSSPYSPPRTPNGSDTISRAEMQSRISDLRSRLDQANDRIAILQRDLGAARSDVQQLNTNLSDRNSSIADLRETVARQHQRLSRHRHSQSPSGSANRPTGRQSPYNRHGENRVSPKQSFERPNPRQAASKNDISLDMEMVRSLIKREKFVEAEALAREVLRSCKERYRDAETKRTETREALLLLCAALRESKKAHQIDEARKLHAAQCTSLGSHAAVRAMTDADINWQFNNAIGLASSFAELGKHKQALQKLTECELVSHLAASEMSQKLTQTLLAMVRICIDDKQPEYAVKAFELVHPSDRRENIPESAPLDVVVRLGIVLFDSGPSYKPAAKRYLRHSYGQRSRLDSAAQRKVGWLLAQLAEGEHSFKEAERLLMSLKPVNWKQSLLPSDESVLAMLAHVQLQLDELEKAEKNAWALWQKYGCRHGQMWHGFDPADTLIQALSRQGEDMSGRHRFWDAHVIWKQVYDDIVLGETNIIDRKSWQSRLLKHAEAGGLLARRWKESCERRGKLPRTADVVQSQVDELRRMAR